MSFILGVFPRQEIQYKIRKSLVEVGKIFETQDIPINYLDRDTYHVTLLFLGQKMSFGKRKKVEFQLRNYSKSPFDASVESVRLGISRDRRELLFFPIIDGAEEMRQLVYEISKSINFKRDRKFIPHISLGRVTKDISDQEFKNLTKSISTLNQSELLDRVEFKVDRFSLAKTEQGEFQFLKNFDI